ncbi:MAG: 4'-phosphopantetheinyl transferase superfamily protein [Vulcanimicrobiaceae bacterium]
MLREAPAREPIAYGETHVWFATVSTFVAYEHDFAGLLDGAETARARRFRAPADRTAYVVAHGLYRRLLARYVGSDARGLHFERGPFGKPELRARYGDAPIASNLSHSGGLVAVAITGGEPVGVDVEAVTADVAFESLAEIAFSASERRDLAAISGDADRRAAYFATWTRKEAYVKALGCGLGERTTTFDVSVDGLARLLRDERDPAAHARWRFCDLTVPDGYAGTVVVATPSSRLRQTMLKGLP